MNESSDAQAFYELARALAEEGVGDLAVAPMGFGMGDPGEARDAIARYRSNHFELPAS